MTKTDAAKIPSSDPRAMLARSVQITADPQVQALIGGMNVRLNFTEALRAVAAAAHACIAGAKAVASQGADVYSVFEAGAQGFHAAVSAIAAVVEKMSALEYIACVLLSEHPNGLDQGAFEQEINKFLNSADRKEFPWYVGINENKVVEAKEDLTNDGIAALVDHLKKSGFLEQSDTMLKFTPRHFTWGIQLSK
jgi:hypothetical protein